MKSQKWEREFFKLAKNMLLGRFYLVNNYDLYKSKSNHNGSEVFSYIGYHDNKQEMRLLLKEVKLEQQRYLVKKLIEEVRNVVIRKTNT